MKSNPFFFYLTLATLLIVFAVRDWQPTMPAKAQAPTTSDAECDINRKVQASGTAVVYVAPDRAMIQLGVQSNGTTPDSVHADNLRQIQRVINAVIALGVDAKDIATDHYIVYPVYSDYNSLTIIGYRINNTVSITLRSVFLTDDVIMTALKVGANEVQDVQFYTSELRKFRDQARDLAMKAAGEKAQALASAAKTQTGCVLSVTENSISHYYGSWQGGRGSAMWTQNVAQNNSSAMGDFSMGDESPVSLGQIAIQAQVNVSYSLK